MSAKGRLSLRAKLILTILPLILIFMGFNFSVILGHEESILRQETEQRALSIATGVATTSAYAYTSMQEFLIEQNVNSLDKLPDVEYIAILNPNGGVQAHSVQSEEGKDDSIRYGWALHARGASTMYVDRHTLEASEPITVQGEHGSERRGTVIVGLSLHKMHAALQSSQHYLLGLTLALMVGAMLFMVMVAQWFTSPILSLVEAARRLADGSLDTKVKKRTNDEIGSLADAFNNMAEKLQDMMQREKEVREKLQRRVSELLAFTEKVASGDLSSEAATGSEDEMGRLVAGFNHMVKELRTTMEQERAIRQDLEASKKALEEANEKLKELDRLKSEFLNTVSHELRTPLTSIKAFSEILLDNQGEDPEVMVEFLSIINQESDRLTRLINNLLDLSRIEAGQMQWDKVPVAIDQVIASCVTATRSLVDKKSLQLEVDVKPGLLTLGDEDKLIQVFTNLISNAIKFTPASGRLWITGKAVSDNELEVAVRDSGIGIPPEFHERIFEKFQQVDTSSTREAKGSGLGLPIVRSIVEAHGGRVTVESAAGQGSTFFVRLPRTATTESTPQPAGEPLHIEAGAVAGLVPTNGHGSTILIVDDETNILRVLRHILETEGHKVVEAQSGQEALTRAREVRPDLVLLDVLLGDIDGFEVLTRLRADPDLKETPVIMLSILEAKEQSFQLGAQDYFSKPIDLAKLTEAVGRLVQDSPRKEVKILVVDDEPNIVQAVTTLLHTRGYETITATDGLQAVVRARESHPDLIILDIYMPEMDGFEVVRRLRSREDTCQIPIIILTASEVALDEVRALSMGVAQYMSKPFSEKELARAVKGALQQMRGKGHGEENSGG
ncbi:MAG: response regulator [Candidatus Xenobia bacterium]